MAHRERTDSLTKEQPDYKYTQRCLVMRHRQEQSNTGKSNEGKSHSHVGRKGAKAESKSKSRQVRRLTFKVKQKVTKRQITDVKTNPPNTMTGNRVNTEGRREGKDGAANVIEAVTHSRQRCTVKNHLLVVLLCGVHC